MTKRKYGSELGDFLRGRRLDIADTEAQAAAGDEQPTSEAVEAAADAIVDEIVAASDGALTVEDYLAMEAGTREPTEEEAGWIAGVLRGHGLEVDAADILAMSETEEGGDGEPTGEEQRQEPEGAAPEPGSGELRTAMELRGRVTSLEEQLREQAPLVEAGQTYLAERRRAVLAAVAVQRGGSPENVPERLRQRIENAALEELEDLASVVGEDALTTPVCAACRERPAVEYRSSIEKTTSGGAPEGSSAATELALGQMKRGDLISLAARALRQKEQGLDLAEATRRVHDMTNAQLRDLIKSAAA